jgi:hypothetical protein
MLITGILIQLLRQEFSGGNMKEEKLDGCVWVPSTNDPLQEDPARSTILIESVYRWDARTTGQRPAILVRRNDQTPKKIGIGGNRVLTMGVPSPLEMRDWSDEYATPMSGSHTIFAIAKEAGQAEVLAQECGEHLRQFGPVFEREFGFLEFNLSQMGAVAQLRESDEHFAVPLGLEYAYYDRWKLIPVAPRFAGVSVRDEGVQ